MALPCPETERSKGVAGSKMSCVEPVNPLSKYPVACVIALILLVFFNFMRSTQAQTPFTVRGQYADWSLRCEAASKETGGKESCALVQSLVDEKRPDMALSVLIIRSPESPKTLTLRVLTPLNVNLVGRLGLKIDALDVGRAAFSRCDRFGCLAEVPFEDGLINQFRAGKVAIFSYYPSGRDGSPVKEGIGFPMPLVGFEEGLQALLQ